jgi:thiol-disulfide isomerase/thioredoxin
MVTEITMHEMATGTTVSDNDMRVVMFFGSTCGPCIATRPHYEESANFFTEKTSRIKFFRINAWEPEEQKVYCTEIWGVQGVPHFKIFCRGEQVIEKIGGGDTPTMMKFIHEGIDEVFKRFGDKI